MLNRLIHVNCVVVQQRLQTLRAAMAEHQDNHWIPALDMSIFLNLELLFTWYQRYNGKCIHVYHHTVIKLHAKYHTKFSQCQDMRFIYKRRAF
mgnify:FL=1